jgi:hypothetical protein
MPAHTELVEGVRASSDNKVYTSTTALPLYLHFPIAKIRWVVGYSHQIGHSSMSYSVDPVDVNDIWLSSSCCCGSGPPCAGGRRGFGAGSSVPRVGGLVSWPP